MVKTVVQPGAIDGQGRRAAVSCAGIVAGTNRADGLAHGKGPGGWHSTTTVGVVWSLIGSLASVGGTFEKGNFTVDVIRKQGTRGVFEHVGIEFLRAAFAGLTGTPIVSGHYVAVVGVGGKEVVVFVDVKHHGDHHLLAVVQATYALRPALGLGQHRQEHRRENPDDGD